MRRFRSQFVCSSINCNPLIVDDQKTSRKTSSHFSHAQLWCRLDWKSVLQLNQARTCAKAIGIQYHSDKDTTTLVFAESGEAFGCLVALRQPNVIIKTGFLCFCEKSWYKLYVLLFGRITALMLRPLTRAKLAQSPSLSYCDCSSAEHEFSSWISRGKRATGAMWLCYWYPSQGMTLACPPTASRGQVVFDNLDFRRSTKSYFI